MLINTPVDAERRQIIEALRQLPLECGAVIFQTLTNCSYNEDECKYVSTRTHMRVHARVHLRNKLPQHICHKSQQLLRPPGASGTLLSDQNSEVTSFNPQGRSWDPRKACKEVASPPGFAAA